MTINNIKVIKGIGKFIDCIGLPLQFVIDELNKNNCLVDWIDFIEYSIDKNWNILQTMSKIEESLIDSDKTYKETVIYKLKLYLINKYSDF
jgi:hypothetical protein